MTTVNHSRWRATALVCASILAVASCDGTSPDGSGPLRQFDLETKWTPTWDDAAVKPSDKVGGHDTADEPDVLDIYLDISRPMGGFLPMRADSVSNEFRTVAQWVPDHLIRLYGRPAVDLRWRSVGKKIGDLPDSPRLDRGLFDETATRLDLAIKDMLANLRAGRAEGAALITDLVGTGELTGALAVSKYLAGWLESKEVRAGRHHLGLIGVKGSYAGATHPRACPEKDGLGCWFSERKQGYQRLDAVATVPFYILLIGTGAGKITEIARSIAEDAKKQGIETRWELLTAQAKPKQTKMTCTAFRQDGGERKDQYALFPNGSGSYECKRSDDVQLDCGFDNEALRPQEVRVPPGADDPQRRFSARIDGARILVTVHCETLKKQELWPDLRLKAEAGLGDATGRWDDWSTETDEHANSLSKTLQLKYFIEKARLRPDQYQADLTLLLGH